MAVGVLAVRHEPASAALVRQAITADLEKQRVTRDTVHDVVLVASELVGNAVVHTDGTDDDHGRSAPPVDVRWDLEDGTVLLQVADASTDVPRTQRPSSTASSGRGLAIVAAIADDWGVRRTERGKQVWARVPVLRD